MDKRSLLFVLVLTAAFFFVHQWFGSKDKERYPVQKEFQEKSSSLSAESEDLQTSSFAKADSLEEKESQEEHFYVLENAYQQLVFSNFGGALAEINLPFTSETNQQSVVRSIGFDKKLEETTPNNATFPLFAYRKISLSSQLEEGKLGGYYPLLRRNIVGNTKKILSPILPRYYAFNIFSQDEEDSKAMYRVKRLEKNLIEFELEQPHRRIIKTFSFPQNPDEAPYCINLKVKVEGDARGLWLTSGVPEVELISDHFSPTLKYRINRNQKPLVEQIDLPKTSTTLTSIHPDWVCNSNGFLGLIIDPLVEIGSGFSANFISGQSTKTRLSLIDPQYDLYPAEKYPAYEIQLPLRASNQTADFRIFAGPFEDDILKLIDRTYSDPLKGYNPNYISCQSFHGWFSFISEPFAKFLFFLMQFFYQISHSWGFSIILLTIALRVMLYPLNAWSIKATARMQQIAPQVTALQEKYKKDPKRAQMEVINLYREKKINPLSGCFPLLIQMPFLIGMFDLLKSTFELRGVSFIPGWINNLTAPDIVFSWNYPLIFFGTSLHLLPILLGIVMYLQQKFSSTYPKDKQLMTDQQKQQKMMGNIMVLVFAVMFYHFPSGLNIYWLSSMLLGILQQWITTKKLLQTKA